MNTKQKMTPREQRDLLYAIREQDAPSPYALVANRVAEEDTIDSHFTLCEAAPDLLAALERIVKFYEAHGACEGSMCEQAKAAIAKAKGGK